MQYFVHSILRSIDLFTVADYLFPDTPQPICQWEPLVFVPWKELMHAPIFTFALPYERALALKWFYLIPNFRLTVTGQVEWLPITDEHVCRLGDLPDVLSPQPNMGVFFTKLMWWKWRMLNELLCAWAITHDSYQQGYRKADEWMKQPTAGGCMWWEAFDAFYFERLLDSSILLELRMMWMGAVHRLIVELKPTYFPRSFPPETDTFLRALLTNS